MGHLCSKHSTVVTADDRPKPPPRPAPAASTPAAPVAPEINSPAGSPFPSPLPAGVAPSPSPARTPRRKFRWPLPPPSPARPIMSAIMRRRGPVRPKEGPIAEAPEEDNEEPRLDKTFGYPKNFGAKFELGGEVGRGHFGHTCRAKGKKGELKGQPVAVKIISKAKVCGMLFP